MHVYSDTTDVQRVSMALSDYAKSIRVQCTFITGSTALGCMVELTSNQNSSGYATIQKQMPVDKFVESDITELTLDTTFPQLCSFLEHGVQIVAYDIEADGSVGSVAIPGTFEKIVAGIDTNHLCNGKSGMK